MSQVATTEKRSIFASAAARYGIEAGKVGEILKNTVFKKASDEQLAALLIVAEKFNLNPFTREIYAFPDSSGGIVPLVGIDGWYRIVNENPQLDGFEFRYAEKTEKASNKENCPEWIECIIYRKDRTRPIIVREYMEECYRDNASPWKTHPRRMLRHKAFIQAARMAFGFSSIYDEDEAERIAEARVVEVTDKMAAPIDVEASAPERPLELPPAARFEILLEDMGVTGERRPLAEEYIAVCCKQFTCGRDEVLGKFLEREDEFRRIYPDWEKNVLAKRQQAVEEKPKRKIAKRQEAEPSPETTPSAPLQSGDIFCPHENSDGSQRIVEMSDCEKCSQRVGCPAHKKDEDSDLGL